MLLGILLTIHIIVCISLIGVVLLQRSEGGALGMGGGPTGFMTARGAGDLLTRATWILGTLFFVLSLVLTVLAGRERGAASVVDRLKIDAVDPNSLNRTPAGPAAPTNPNAPAPLTAPTPQVRNPFTGAAGEQEQTNPTAPSPSNP
jgi:preprotein translocase subunit SecG